MQNCSLCYAGARRLNLWNRKSASYKFVSRKKRFGTVFTNMLVQYFFSLIQITEPTGDN